MKHYELQYDEVILYRGPVNLLPDGKPEKPTRFRNTETDVILTNKKLVVDVIIQKIFGKKVETRIYDVKDIKVYQETPQVLQKGAYVDVYLFGTELFLQFPNKKQAALFNNAALRLLTGQSKLVRGVKKTQKAVKETEDQLNIDITETAKVAAVVAVEMAAGSNGKKAKTIGTFAQKLFAKKKEKQLPPAEGNTEE